MLKVLIQQLLSGQMSLWKATLTAWIIDHSERAQVELAQQESLEQFLEGVRNAHRYRSKIRRTARRTTWMAEGHSTSA